jgi:hypothetical protein
MQSLPHSQKNFNTKYIKEKKLTKTKQQTLDNEKRCDGVFV